MVGADEAVGGGRQGQRVDEDVEHGAGRGWEVAAAHHGRLDRPHQVEGVAEGVAIDVVHPGRVDGGPAHLPGAQFVGVELGGGLGDRGEQRTEAVGAEQDPGAVVDEAGGDGVVVDGRLARRSAGGRRQSWTGRG